MATDAVRRFLVRQGEPVDAASMLAFRLMFGVLMFVGVLRFFAFGWIETLYVEPTYFFTYEGLSWVKPWPAWGMYLHFAALGVLALLVASGRLHRVSVGLFFLAFTYVELIDKTNYLNHYYLVSLLALLMLFMPLHRGGTHAPRWCLTTLRAQVGLVYVFAGLAKLRADWLLDAQPLTIWFAASGDAPLVGQLVSLPYAAHVASWFGAAFDLTFPFWMSWRRARPFAFAAALVFHLVTGVLFELGLFPFIMVAAATLFFPPDWPRGRKPAAEPPPGRRLHPAAAGLLALHFVVQILVPLRKHLYAGDVAWTQRGFRFSWHVMVAESAGIVWFHVRDPATDTWWTVRPETRLTPRQCKMMSTQPDMISQFARALAAEHGAPVEVYAEVYVSLNGRPSRPLMDPNENLIRATATANDDVGVP